MEDQGILELFFARSEQAIAETDRKYGGYCYSIAYNILSSKEDSEESVSDTYLAAWNLIPPRKPNFLNAFLGKITRHISIDRWRKLNARKRGGKETVLALEELGECTASSDMETEIAQRELARILNDFLENLPETERHVFLCRYWYFDSAQDIALHFGFSSGKVRSMLHRTRKKLQSHLKREGLL